MASPAPYRRARRSAPFNGDQLVDARAGEMMSRYRRARRSAGRIPCRSPVGIRRGLVAQLRWARTGIITPPGPKETPRISWVPGGATIPPSPTQTRIKNSSGSAAMDPARYTAVGHGSPPDPHGPRTLGPPDPRVSGTDNQPPEKPGAPLGGKRVSDSPNRTATDKDGNPSSRKTRPRPSPSPRRRQHRMLRRPYSYNETASTSRCRA